MNKIAILYYSGIGNTRIIAQYMYKYLKQKNIVDIYSIEELSTEFSFDKYSKLINQEQCEKIEEFKEKYKGKGIYQSVKDKEDFKRLFTKHLQMYFLGLIMNKNEDDNESKQPKLTVKGTNVNVGDPVATEERNFLESEFLTNKQKDIIKKIEHLNSTILQVEPIKENTKPKEGIFSIDDFRSVQVGGEDIELIEKFAKDNRIVLHEGFWSLGNLKKKIVLLSATNIGYLKHNVAMAFPASCIVF